MVVSRASIGPRTRRSVKAAPMALPTLIAGGPDCAPDLAVKPGGRTVHPFWEAKEKLEKTIDWPVSRQ